MFTVFLGSLDNAKSLGTNNLIKQFAKIATTPQDITKNYKFLTKSKEIIQSNSNKGEDEPNNNYIGQYKNIYNILSKKPMYIDDIVRISNIDFKEVMYQLTMLELNGKIKKLPTNCYIINND